MTDLPAPSTTAPSTPAASPWAVLGVVGAGSFMTSLDGSIVNIGLPAIGRSFGAPLGGGTEWVLIAYLVAMAATLLTFGRLADTVGRKPIWVAGVALFTLASAGGGAAPALGWLVATRVLQGVGGALIFAPAVALITDAFPAPRRGRALGLLAVVTSVGVTVGPTLGGVITEYLSWRWIFYVNLPVGALTLFASWRLLPAAARTARTPTDLRGALLIAVGLAGLTLALSFGSTAGWTSARVLGAAAAGVAALVATVLVERRVAHPLLDLALFRDRAFALALASLVLNFLSLTAIGFLLPFYFEQLRGFSTVRSGLMLMPLSVAVALVAPLSGTLADRVGARWIASGGIALTCVALVLLAGLDATTTTVGVAWRLVVAGVGIGAFQAPNTTALMAAAPAGEQGQASGLQATGRVAGQSLGVALAGAVYTGLGGALAGAALTAPATAGRAALAGVALAATQAGFVHAFRMAMLVSAAISAIGVFTSLARGGGARGASKGASTGTAASPAGRPPSPTGAAPVGA